MKRLTYILLLFSLISFAQVKKNKSVEYKKLSRYKAKKSRGRDYSRIQFDSVNYYKNKNIDKSIGFVESVLKNNPTTKETAQSYKLLGDIYFKWKQYDLAIENYKTSLNFNFSIQSNLKLAETYLIIEDYKQSKKSYLKLLNNTRNHYQLIKIYQGLSEISVIEKKYTQAESYLKKALKLAEDNLVTPKITDINSKLAEVYSKQGNSPKAELYYNNALNLSSKEAPIRAVQQQQKVSAYLNLSNRYDEEIKLRKQTLKKVEKEEIEEYEENEIAEEIELDSKKEKINTQQLNFEIGNAYIQKKDFGNAIPYLKKSIKVANKKKDLVVKKDATQKLSEIYAKSGDYAKALKSYEAYVNLVDTLYKQKEQEIIQAKQFTKKIASNKNRIKSLEKDRELTQSKIELYNKEQQLTEESYKRQQIFIYALIFGFLLMSLLAYLLYRNIKQQKLANNLLALKSMRSQMNPHFIFNALNSVNSFIAVNDELNANRYLSQFSSLMRAVLENSEEDFIPLSKEIELLQLYTKLEHHRFKDKFDYKISIDDTIDLDSFEIPPMLLQPYIENAIWHGLRYKDKKGNLLISIKSKTNTSIEIQIIDDGVGRKKSKELKTVNQLKQKSKGMSTVSGRIKILNNMYQDKIAVDITNLNDDATGTKVIVRLKK